MESKWMHMDIENTMLKITSTCFMNSVLQGLIATKLLEELVLFRSPTQRFVQPSASRCSPLITNGRGPEGLQQEWVRGMSLGDVFIATLERAWRMRDAKDRSSMSPKLVKNHIQGFGLTLNEQRAPYSPWTKVRPIFGRGHLCNLACYYVSHISRSSGSKMPMNFFYTY